MILDLGMSLQLNMRRKFLICYEYLSEKRYNTPLARQTDRQTDTHIKQ